VRRPPQGGARVDDREAVAGACTHGAGAARSPAGSARSGGTSLAPSSVIGGRDGPLGPTTGHRHGPKASIRWCSAHDLSDSAGSTGNIRPRDQPGERWTTTRIKALKLGDDQQQEGIGRRPPPARLGSWEHLCRAEREVRAAHPGRRSRNAHRRRRCTPGRAAPSRSRPDLPADLRHL